MLPSDGYQRRAGLRLAFLARQSLPRFGDCPRHWPLYPFQPLVAILITMCWHWPRSDEHFASRYNNSLFLLNITRQGLVHRWTARCLSIADRLRRFTRRTDARPLKPRPRHYLFDSLGGCLWETTLPACSGNPFPAHSRSSGARRRAGHESGALYGCPRMSGGGLCVVRSWSPLGQSDHTDSLRL